VPRFLERFPAIPLEVELGESADGARSAEFDVVVKAGASTDPEQTSRVLGAPPAVLVATPGYLQRFPLPVRPEELEGHELLTPESGAGPLFTLRLSQGLRRAEVSVRPKLAVNDPALLHAAAAAGLGIALLPEFLCRQGLATQKLRQVLPDWELPEQAALCAIYPSRLAQDPRVNALVEFLAANIVPALAR
jgi:DNA-binding transcriptional LysR family regulator